MNLHQRSYRPTQYNEDLGKDRFECTNCNHQVNGITYTALAFKQEQFDYYTIRCPNCCICPVGEFVQVESVK